jgi:hypothetical protein
MFRKVAWLGILAFALPLAAFANEIGLTNAAGVVIGNAGGLALAGSTLIKYGTVVGTNLGSLTFTTGALPAVTYKTAVPWRLAATSPSPEMEPTESPTALFSTEPSVAR